MASALPACLDQKEKLINGAFRGDSEMLPETDELKYKQKCKDLRKRTREIEKHNEIVTISIARTKRAIQRVRLERALLLEKLEERTILKAEDSDGTPSPPASPVMPSAEYTHFCEQERDKIQSSNEYDDIDAALATAWKTLSAEDRAKYAENGSARSLAVKDEDAPKQTLPILKVLKSKSITAADETRSDDTSESDLDQSDMPPPSSEL